MEEKTSVYKIYRGTALTIFIAGIIILVTTSIFMAKTNSSFFSTSKGIQEISHGSSQSLTGKKNTVQGSTDSGENTIATEDITADNRDYLILNSTSSDSQYLWIPVPEGKSSSDIVIENHYMDRELWVLVTGGDSAYYDDNAISGDLSGVAYGEAVQTEDAVVLKFALDKVYEFNTIFEEGVLYVEKVSPRQIYDKIVIVDPCGMIPEEMLFEDSLTPSRICLDIAVKVQNLLEKENIRVYMTSMDERELTDDERLSLSADVRPDMFIRIETGYNSDSKVYGTETVYNGTYFIPGFGSVELADFLESDVTTAIGGKATGLVEAKESDYLVNKATVPTAAVRVGYYTNAQENILLNRDDYRSKIAQGIVNAVMDGFAMKNGE